MNTISSSSKELYVFLQHYLNNGIRRKLAGWSVVLLDKLLACGIRLVPGVL